jgi:hypothetical protein
MYLSLKRVAYFAVFLVLGLGLSRAALSRFQEKEQAIYKACREQVEKMGVPRGTLKAKYPTPEIHMVSSGCLMPGSTGEVVVKGKFATGTQFVFENDNVEVVKDALTPTEYHATVKIAPGIGPQSAGLIAVTPVTGITARTDQAISIGGKYEWKIEAANGWKILARSPATKACGGKSSAGDVYEMLFYRQGEANPFTKRKATLYFSVFERTNYRFRIDQTDPESQGSAEGMAALMQKMADPGLTNEQREQIMQSLVKLQTQMQGDLAKLADPAYIAQQEAKRAQFGCEQIELEAPGGSFTGEMRCADKVGRRIHLTGTVAALGR